MGRASVNEDGARSRRDALVVLPVLAVLLTCGVAALVHAMQTSRHDEERVRVHAAVERALRGAAPDPAALAIAADVAWGGSGLDRRDFEDAADALIAEGSADTVSWLEIVRPAGIAAWEDRWEATVAPYEGAQPFALDGAAAVVTVVRPPDPAYDDLVGLDLSAERSVGPILRAATDGRVSMTEPLRLGGESLGVVIAAPVKAGDDVVGFITTTHPIAVFDAAVRNGIAEGGAVLVRDGDTVLIDTGLDGSGLSRTIDMLGRRWEVTVTTPGPPVFWPWVLLGGGLATIAIAVVLARARRRQVERLRLIDAERAARRRADEASAASRRSETRLRIFVDATSHVLWSTTPDGTMKPSPSWEAFTGQATEEYTRHGDGGFAVVHPDDRQLMEDAWRLAYTSHDRYEAVFRLRRHDGEYRRVRSVGLPITDDVGDVIEWFGSIVDIEMELSAIDAVEQQHNLLSTITENALSALFLMDADGRPTFMNPAATEMFGFVLDEIAERPLHESVHHTHPDGTHYPIEECPIDRALPERRVLEPYEDVFIRKDGRFLPVRASASPILRDGRPVGTVVEVRDVSEERHLAAEVSRAAARASMLADLSSELERGPSALERSERAADLIAERLNCSVTISLVQAHTTAPEVVHRDAPRPSDEGLTSTTVLMLRGRRRSIGTVEFRGDVEASLTGEIAQRLTTALDNALLYDQERHVSHALQTGLLGGPAAGVDGFAVTSAYRPGTDALEVGGDWYDVFPVRDGLVAAVVGDVAGHNLDAAIAMGHIRGAVRAAARSGGPGVVLRSLEAYLQMLPSTVMVTLAYVEIDQFTGSARYVSAGHPPPIVRTSAGVDWLWDGRLPPAGLGMIGAGTVLEGEYVLAPGDVLVLYTDGLVERRTEVLDVGLGRLEAAVLDVLPPSDVGCPDDEPVEQPTVAEMIATALLDHTVHDDDACVLTVCLSPLGHASFADDFVASTDALVAVRRRFTAWLADDTAHGGAAIPTDTVRDVALAVGEALANAVEHGHDIDGARPVTLRATVHDRSVQVIVGDLGRWDETAPDPQRGLGLMIMSAVMDEVAVHRSPRGSTIRLATSWDPPA